MKIRSIVAQVIREDGKTSMVRFAPPAPPYQWHADADTLRQNEPLVEALGEFIVGIDVPLGEV